jgi:hypothetical protein
LGRLVFATTETPPVARSGPRSALTTVKRYQGNANSGRGSPKSFDRIPNSNAQTVVGDDSDEGQDRAWRISPHVSILPLADDARAA